MKYTKVINALTPKYKGATITIMDITTTEDIINNDRLHIVFNDGRVIVVSGQETSEGDELNIQEFENFQQYSDYEKKFNE